jgi:hypothetical protein
MPRRKQTENSDAAAPIEVVAPTASNRRTTRSSKTVTPNEDAAASSRKRSAIRNRNESQATNTTQTTSTGRATNRQAANTTQLANGTQAANTTQESLKEIFKKGREGEFPDVILHFNDSSFPYTPILNFFEIPKQFNFNKSELKEMQIKVSCLICKKEYKCRQGRFTNLNSHIKDHAYTGFKNVECQEWLRRYNEFKKSGNKAINSIENRNKMLLILYFISSNAALAELKNKAFRKICQKAQIEVPNYKTFKQNVLPGAMKLLHEAIQEKLVESESICLITDIWTNKQMLDFIAVSANIIFKTFEKETIVIGMMKMPGPHNAENIKICVEQIVNEYDFDKSKVKGKMCLLFNKA